MRTLPWLVITLVGERPVLLKEPTLPPSFMQVPVFRNKLFLGKSKVVTCSLNWLQPSAVTLILPEWLKSTWLQMELWMHWREVRIPESCVVAYGLVGGRAQGYETLVWLEVGDAHKSEDRILKITRKRLVHARRLCQRTGVRLVYTQLKLGP